ncbi:MAG: hypothetical protein EZS28_021207, partial [Streblomastix strix]
MPQKNNLATSESDQNQQLQITIQQLESVLPQLNDAEFNVFPFISPLVKTKQLSTNVLNQCEEQMEWAIAISRENHDNLGESRAYFTFAMQAKAAQSNDIALESVKKANKT